MLEIASKSQFRTDEFQSFKFIKVAFAIFHIIDSFALTRKENAFNPRFRFCQFKTHC